MKHCVYSAVQIVKMEEISKNILPKLKICSILFELVVKNEERKRK